MALEPGPAKVEYGPAKAELELSDAEREQLESWARRVRARRRWRCVADRVGGRQGVSEQRDRASGWGIACDGAASGATGSRPSGWRAAR